jgi:hypothetical protein
MCGVGWGFFPRLGGGGGRASESWSLGSGLAAWALGRSKQLESGALPFTDQQPHSRHQHKR